MKNKFLVAVLTTTLLFIPVFYSFAQQITVASDVIGFGNSVEASFSEAPAHPNTWIGLFNYRFGNGEWFSYQYLNNQTEGIVALSHPMETGLFDFRMFNSENQLIGRSQPFLLRNATQADPDFHTNGVYHLSVSTSNLDDWVSDIEIASDGKIVVAGAVQNGLTSVSGLPMVDFVVVRLLPGGQPDLSFGQNGIARVSIQGTDAEDVTAVEVQPDGKIIVGGTGYNFLQGNDIWDICRIPGSFILLRLLDNGTPDNSFGNGGIVLQNFTLQGEPAGFSTDRLTCLALQPDGKILAGGYGDRCHNGFIKRCIVARYLTNGVPDPSFGDNGKLVFVLNTSHEHWVNSIVPPAENSDGSFFVGTMETAWESFFPNVNLLYKFNEDGTLATSFGDNGIVTDTPVGLPGFSLNQSIKSMGIGPDNQLYIMGSTGISGRIWIMKKDPETGLSDNSFGTEGLTVFDNAPYFQEPIDMAFHNNMIYVGTSDYLGGFAFSAVRCNLDGENDITFGHPFAVPRNGQDRALAMDMTSTGDLIYGGFGLYPPNDNKDFFIYKLNHNTAQYLHDQQQSAGSNECCGSNSDIYVRDVMVASDARLELVAAKKIFLWSHFAVNQGGIFHARITTTGNYCSQPPVLVKSPEIIDLIIPDNAPVNSHEIRAYPNPTNGIITIEIATKNFQEAIIEVIDITGRSVLTHRSIQSKIDLNLENLAKSLYSIRVTIANQYKIFNIIKN